MGAGTIVGLVVGAAKFVYSLIVKKNKKDAATKKAAKIKEAEVNASATATKEIVEDERTIDTKVSTDAAILNESDSLQRDGDIIKDAIKRANSDS